MGNVGYNRITISQLPAKRIGALPTTTSSVSDANKLNSHLVVDHRGSCWKSPVSSVQPMERDVPPE